MSLYNLGRQTYMFESFEFYHICVLGGFLSSGIRRRVTGLDPEDEGTVCFRNIGNRLPIDIMSYQNDGIFIYTRTVKPA